MNPITLAPDAWVAVSRAALRHNYRAVSELAATQVIAVVKANAFGHGAGAAACVFQDAGADFFAVTTPAEALELREAGITGRILVFVPALPDQADTLADMDLDLTVTCRDDLKCLAAAAQYQGKTVRVHLKVDTGMGRFGVLPMEASTLARQITDTAHVTLAGTYTHFARALEKNPAATQKQFHVFQDVLSQQVTAGVDPGLRHCANSAATVRFPEMRLDAVRPGTILYGQYPSATVPRTLDLRETWRLQARVVAVRDVPAGTPLGYGGEYVTRRPTRLAVLPIGYSDGFTTAPASATGGWRGLKALLRPGPGPRVTLRGRQAPVRGRVAMQTCTVDVTDIPGVALGDIATVPARRLMTSARLPRLFTDEFE